MIDELGTRYKGFTTTTLYSSVQAYKCPASDIRQLASEAKDHDCRPVFQLLLIRQSELVCKEDYRLGILMVVSRMNDTR